MPARRIPNGLFLAASAAFPAMTRDSQATKQRILDAAHELFLRQGFAATSLDRVLEQAEVTKGAFFHHFESKLELGEQVMERFLEADRALLDEVMNKAEALASDPLQQVLVVIGLLRDLLSESGAAEAGCLIAAYCYQEELMTPRVRQWTADEMRAWRERLADKLRAAARLHPPRTAVDPEVLADHVNTVVEGAFVMAKTFGDPSILPRQLELVRTHLALLFDAPLPPLRGGA